MRLKIQPKPRTSNSPDAPARPTPPRETTAPTREATIRLDRLQIEGCGPVSPHALREGFRSVWVANRPALEQLAARPDALAKALAAPLDLHFQTAPDGFRLGQAIARSLLSK